MNFKSFEKKIFKERKNKERKRHKQTFELENKKLLEVTTYISYQREMSTTVDKSGKTITKMKRIILEGKRKRKREEIKLEVERVEE